MTGGLSEGLKPPRDDIRGGASMSCKHVEHELDAYLDLELDAAASKAVRDHLGECAACRRQAAEREALGRLVRAAPHYQVPARLREKVLALVKRSGSVSAV